MGAQPVEYQPRFAESGRRADQGHLQTEHIVERRDQLTPF
jgi:hypothetical protein